MKVAFFSARDYDIAYFDGNRSPHQFTFIKEKLDPVTVFLAKGMDAVCIAATDLADNAVIAAINKLEIRFMMVRSSSLDKVDTNAADKAGIVIKYLPGYSPQAIAEHAVALLLALNRNVHLAYERIMKGNFSIEGLMGFNLRDKTVGIVGLGRIGQVFANIMKGFGCHIIVNDTKQNVNITHSDMQFVSLPKLLQSSDIISLHCSLNDTSGAILNTQTLQLIKPGTFLINTARGKLVDTKAVLEGLNNGILGAYGADVYAQEHHFFNQTFESVNDLNDPDLRALIQHPRVLLTARQAYFAREAMKQMTRTVIKELTYQESLSGSSTDRLMI